MSLHVAVSVFSEHVQVEVEAAPLGQSSVVWVKFRTDDGAVLLQVDVDYVHGFAAALNGAVGKLRSIADDLRTPEPLDPPLWIDNGDAVAGVDA